MSGWSGWPPPLDGEFSDALAATFAAICVTPHSCQLFDQPGSWFRSKLPRRWTSTSTADPMCAAWVDLVLSARGLAVIAWVFDAPVAALGMLPVAMFASLLLRSPKLTPTRDVAPVTFRGSHRQKRSNKAI